MKKYINVMIICMFAFMACEVEDKLADALTPSVNTDWAGTWSHTYQGTYANGDCTGDLTAGATTDATITLNTDGTYTTDVGTGPGENDSGTWSSTATTLTINYFGGFLPYTYTVETTDGVTTMYNNQEAETGLGAMCTKSVYTLQAS